MSQPATLLAAPIPAELADDARDLVERIRRHGDPTALRGEGAEMVMRLTEAGLEAFFLGPVEELGLGLMTRSMVRVGLASATKAIGVFVHRIVGGLSREQIVAVADRVDGMLVEVGAP